MRINAYLANAGISSRRKADELIKAGRVSVNGRPAALNGQVSDNDEVRLDGQKVSFRPLRYIILNKPVGYVTTRADPQGRPKVTDLIDAGATLKPVGRLDIDTSGLILFTNDGQLAYRLMHPSHGIDKTYQVVVKGKITDEILDLLSNGVRLDDGLSAPAQARKIDGQTLELIIHEGKKRQVRRMVAAVGLELVSLKRTAYGQLKLEGLADGQWRQLTDAEVTALKQA